MTRIQKTVFILVALIALVVRLTVSKVLNSQRQLDPTQLLDAGIVLLPQSRPVPALSLTDQDGEAVQLDALKGQWTLLFFGYTFCPDICPTTLAELRQLNGMLPETVRGQLRTILVSVDPDRDTPAQLKEYLGYFNAGFQGLTGPLDDIRPWPTASAFPSFRGYQQGELHRRPQRQPGPDRPGRPPARLYPFALAGAETGRAVA